jgi:hypothetical protein
MGRKRKAVDNAPVTLEGQEYNRQALAPMVSAEKVYSSTIADGASYTFLLDSGYYNTTLGTPFVTCDYDNNQLVTHALGYYQFVVEWKITVTTLVGAPYITVALLYDGLTQQLVRIPMAAVAYSTTLGGTVIWTEPSAVGGTWRTRLTNNTGANITASTMRLTCTFIGLKQD